MTGLNFELLATDAVVLAPVADTVLLVVRAGQTKRDHVRRALEALHQVKVEPAGAVLNAATADARGYGYGYGYGPTSDARRARTPEAARR